MRIRDIQTVLLTGPLSADPSILPAKKTRSAAFVELRDDAGNVGVGETYAGYFCPEVVPQIVAFFRPILLGQDTDAIETLWQRMYTCGNYWCRVGLGAIVLSGVEAALWDLRGKQLGLPVHAMLGDAAPARLPAYATGGPSNYPRDQLAAKVDRYLQAGFRGVKIGAGCLHAEQGWQAGGDSADSIAAFEGEKLAFLREHLGADAWICVDGHMGNSPFGAWDFDTAMAVMRAVAPANLTFFEEPLPYTDYQAYRALTRESPVPIAGGECLSTMSEWQVYLEHDCFAIPQPDASYNGGLLQTMAIARASAARGRRIAPHAWGAGACLMQNIHCGFAAGNTAILEVPPLVAGLHADLLTDAFCMQDGYVLRPDAPGLGVDLSEAVKARYPFQPGSGEFVSVPGKILNS